jgi:hypothetical protein
MIRTAKVQRLKTTLNNRTLSSSSVSELFFTPPHPRGPVAFSNFAGGVASLGWKSGVGLVDTA